MLHKGIWQVLIGALATVAAFSAWPDDNAVFGALKGDFTVESGGVANYAVPIELPNSRGSFRPSLAIQYSSKSEDGELGVGFRVSGGGSITRCQQTVEQDGKAGRISYDVAGDTGTSAGITDRFCLEGERLVLVSGQYGYDESEYRTEIDSQRRIKFYAPASPGQPYFTVESSNGVIRTYGGTDNSLQKTTELAVPKVASWLLHKVSDRNGNFYEYQYLGAAAPGAEQFLGKVLYGANSVLPSSFDYEVDFVYEARPDQTKKYLNSVKYINDRRLKQINVIRLGGGANTHLEKYSISYQQGATSGKSRVASVTQCNKQKATTNFDCALPIQFSWADNASADPAWDKKSTHDLPVELFASGSDGSVRPKYIRFVDLNGDGVNDIIWSTLRFVEGVGASVARGAYINTPDGWQSKPEYWLPLADSQGGAPSTVTQYDSDNHFNELGSEFVDLNGDGLVDFVYRYKVTAFGQGVAAYGAYIQKRTVDGSESSRWQYESKYEPPSNLFFRSQEAGFTPPRFVDVNGDGLVDMLYRAAGYTGGYAELNGSYALINTPSATGASYWISDSTYLLPMPIYLNTRASITSTTPALPGDVSARFVDLNGDGLQDFIYYRAINGTVQKRAYINNQYGAADNAGWACDSANNNTYTSGGGSKWVCNDAYMPPTPMYRDDDRAANPLNEIYPLNDLGARFVDLNNDGLQDFIFSRESQYDDSGTERTSTVILSGAYLNTGRGWIPAPEFKLPNAPAGASLPGQLLLSADAFSYFGRHFVDVNGDNLLDFIYNWKELNTSNQVVSLDAGAYVNTGAGWRREERFTPPCPIYSFYYQYWGGRVDDLNGDGIADVACRRADIPATNGAYISKPRVDLLKNITDGFGGTLELAFSPISNRSIYTAAATSAYPDPEVARPVYVVSKIVRPAETGDGTLVTIRYSYGGLKTNMKGRGAIGFESVVEEVEYPASISSLDNSTRFEITETNYSQTFPYYGFVTSQKKFIRKNSDARIMVSTRESAPAADFGLKTPYDGVYLPYVKNLLEIGFDPVTGSQLTSRLITEDVDSYANRLSHQEKVTQTSGGAAFTTTVANTYLAPDMSTWQVARLDVQTTTYQRSAATAAIVRTRKQTYFSNGLMQQEIQEPDSALYKLTTAFTYDAYGNVVGRVVTGAGDASIARSDIAARTESFSYLAGTDYSEGIFLSSRVNPKNQPSAYVYDPVTGAVLSETDPNGVKTVFERDVFGLETAKKKQVGTSSRTMAATQYAMCSTGLGCQPDESYRMVVTLAGAAAVEVYYDRLGRERRRVTKAYDANPTLSPSVVAAIGYDARGARICESRFMSGTAPTALQACGSSGGVNKWTRYQYDGARRQILKTEPTGNTVTTYTGLAVQVSNALGQTRSELRNALGETDSITDAAGKVVSFKYDAAGFVLEMQDPLNNLIVYTYDLLGRRKTMSDPVLGSWEYTYNVAGELIRQKDAKNQVVEIYYDELGRRLRREESDLISDWAYDTALNGIGKLATASASNDYLETPSYDIWGRLKQTSTKIDNVNHVIIMDYDDADRTVGVTYPTGFKYQNIYDNNGFLTKVQDATASASSHPVYWSAVARDEEGRITRETLGNGLKTVRGYYADSGRINSIQVGTEVNSVLQPTVQNDSYYFDALGNLGSRSQTVVANSFAEFFEYDVMNRVKTAYTADGAQRLVAYDALGNITSHSDIGTYSYVGCGGGHRVCKTSGFLNAWFSYDANGNMLTRSYDEDVSTLSGNDLGYAWTSYNMPSTMTQGSTTETFLYGSEHQRVRRISIVNGQTTTITYLNPRIDMGGTYEKAAKPDGTIEHTQHIYADGRVIGAVVQTDAVPNAPIARYFHQDHIGSITAISDDSAQVEYLSYDMWGRRRALNGEEDMTVTPVHGLSGMQLPAVGTDPYVLIQRDAISNELTLHTSNKFKTSPVALGQAVPSGDIMRLGMEVRTAVGAQGKSNFQAAIENTALGTVNYRRYGAYTKQGRWMLHTCVGTAPCEEVSLGDNTAKNDTVYVVQLTSTPVSSRLRIYEKNTPQALVLQDMRGWDVSAGGAVTQKRPVIGVQLRTNALLIGSIVLPIRRRDAVTTVETLNWEKLTQSQTPINYSAVGTRHGFTSHEQLDSMGLVHMNGRVYDPLIGRFLTADPNIFYPDNTQDYNRYSYVWNNPLSLTDPSGFAVEFCGSSDPMYSVGSSYGVSGYGSVASWFGNGTGQQISTYAPVALRPVNGTVAQRIEAARDPTRWDDFKTGLGDRMAVLGGRDEYGLRYNSITGSALSLGNEQAAREGLLLDVGSTVVGGRLVSGAAQIVKPYVTTIGSAVAERVAPYLAKPLGSVANTAEKGGLNLFKWGKDTTTKASGWKEGDFMLHLPNQGSPKANWAQNSSRLREEMSKGNPIFDSYRNPATGARIPTDGFLRAERNLLETRGWQYNPSTGAYYPPLN